MVGFYIVIGIVVLAVGVTFWLTESIKKTLVAVMAACIVVIADWFINFDDVRWLSCYVTAKREETTKASILLRVDTSNCGTLRNDNNLWVWKWNEKSVWSQITLNTTYRFRVAGSSFYSPNILEVGSDE